MGPKKCPETTLFSDIAGQLGVTDTSSGQVVPTCLLRLKGALASTNAAGLGKPSRLDLAVLIRQCLRNYDSQSGFHAHARIRLPRGQSWPTDQDWEMVGVTAVLTENGTTIQASPWLPSWLSDPPSGGVDGAASSESQGRRTNPVPGDPFMRGIPGHQNYQSPGQRASVRAALCARRVPLSWFVSRPGKVRASYFRPSPPSGTG